METKSALFWTIPFGTFSKEERIRNQSDEFKGGVWERPGSLALADGWRALDNHLPDTCEYLYFDE